MWIFVGVIAMKTPLEVLAPALVLGLLASPASASGFYAGVEVGAATVPDLKDSVTQTMVNYGGFTSVTTSENSNDGQAGIYGGQWLTDNFGWEANLASLGSIRGEIATATTSNFYTWDYRYDTAALSLAALGGVNVGPGKLFIKAGVYDAGVTFDGPTSTVTRNSAGPVIGGGFSMSVMKRFIAKVELANYVGVKFPAYEFFNQSSQIRKTNITTLSIGIAYGF
jgi:hypothetical protein